MLKIHNNYDKTMGGYILEGKNVMGIHCKNSKEVATAIEHYMGPGTFYGHACYLINNKRCPICRAILKRDNRK